MTMRISRRGAVLALAASPWSAWPAQGSLQLQSWPLKTPRATGIHDVAPAPGRAVWFTAQRSGQLGWFDPGSGQADMIDLGAGSAPHGVIPGPDHAAWITDGGAQAIVRVDAKTRELRRFPLPDTAPYANLNTASFDHEGILWFTGQSGVIGRLDPRRGELTLKDAPGGRGPYGICTTRSGEVWWCSLAGSFIARIDRRSGESTVVEPPTRRQGARRIWGDSRGRLWISEWLSGQLSMHDPRSQAWRAWKLPGHEPKPYAVYVDEHDQVWLSDFGANAVLRFDPASERFDWLVFPREAASVRQIAGRPGEVWLPESGSEHLSLLRTG
jgi:virginiamycin B lyase